MLELEYKAPRSFLEKFGWWFVTYRCEGGCMDVVCMADAMPDDVTDIDDVRISIGKAGSADGFLTTNISFSGGEYAVDCDEAPFTRTQVNRAIDLALEKLPEVFPNVTLPGGYPTERSFMPW